MRALPAQHRHHVVAQAGHQRVQNQRREERGEAPRLVELDLRRTAQFTLYGAFWAGPVNGPWFALLGRFWRAPRFSPAQQLAGKMRQVPCIEGADLITAGDPSLSMFILVEGLMEVVSFRTGEPRVVATILPGECIGELAFFGGMARASSVRTATGSVAFEISKGKFVLGWLSRSVRGTWLG